MGSNLGYLLKSFLIYNTCIIKWSVTCCFDWWNLTSISLEITCIYLKIPMHGAKTSPNYRLYWISSSHHTTFVLLQSWCCWIQIIGWGWPKKLLNKKKIKLFASFLLNKKNYQRTSAAALALGHNLGIALMELTNSPHKHT